MSKRTLTKQEKMSILKEAMTLSFIEYHCELVYN